MFFANRLGKPAMVSLAMPVALLVLSVIVQPSLARQTQLQAVLRAGDGVPLDDAGAISGDTAPLRPPEQTPSLVPTRGPLRL